ncbi:hypothetical protein FE257_010877 [Aspergillus nanangensis]|uniref:Cyclin-dependent protein kinase regulator Pho80 n=1 Tax=Aspergillus nanangensis TaxID=2582783 RepID=A0AAD4CVN3_ASPNN|nr:hypothetical protein FE257_010877 [Aspergillus nanangensis]
MLVSSPSPSALRPAPSSSSPSAPLPSISSPPIPIVSTSASASNITSPYHRHFQQQQQYYHHHTSATTAPPPQPSTSSLQYDPAGTASAVSGIGQHHHLSPHSSRLAIEELRSALTRHTVAPSPPGPSGDLPRGCMSAGLTSSGGGTSTTTPPTAVPVPVPVPVPTAAPVAENPTSAPAPPSFPASQPSVAPPAAMPAPNSSGTASNKRNSPNDPVANGTLVAAATPANQEGSSSKRLRPVNPSVKVLPAQYELAEPRDLVVLISSMLMELIRFNDKIPLNQGRLTRFHSRSPPRISVQDYLQRLTTHATLSPPILLSMVYYIDRLCALYPAFTVSSLTIHRFLIASATVASKGLSDSFWTNKTYARVGGISMTELALLELEFLFRVEWRIVPQPEVLVDYYQSLVERCEGYELQRDE